MSFQGTTRTDPYVRSLAHTALISDEWRQAIKNSLSAHPPAPVTRVSRSVSGACWTDGCSP